MHPCPVSCPGISIPSRCLGRHSARGGSVSVFAAPSSAPNRRRTTGKVRVPPGRLAHFAVAAIWQQLLCSVAHGGNSVAASVLSWKTEATELPPRKRARRPNSPRTLPGVSGGNSARCLGQQKQQSRPCLGSASAVISCPAGFSGPGAQPAGCCFPRTR